MSILDNILSLLKTWGPWKRIQEAPGRIDDLEKRITELEKRLERVPGEACPRCGKLAFRVVESKPAPGFGEFGVRIHTMKCEECDFTDKKRAP
ncbi:hypothetical protein MYX82_03770 [Acidobacteria bacterium AH-259-D05]|nr:hypothetical protein [Acidobacteria bacterium AH-259-D05]